MIISFKEDFWRKAKKNNVWKQQTAIVKEARNEKKKQRNKEKNKRRRKDKARKSHLTPSANHRRMNNSFILKLIMGAMLAKHR